MIQVLKYPSEQQSLVDTIVAQVRATADMLAACSTHKATGGGYYYANRVQQHDSLKKALGKTLDVLGEFSNTLQLSNEERREIMLAVNRLREVHFEDRDVRMRLEMFIANIEHHMSNV